MIPPLNPRRREYEREVRSLAAIADRPLRRGDPPEQVARRLVAMRNAIKVKYRALDPPELVARFEARNVELYGNPIGPTAESAFDKYGSWPKVIEATARPGGGELRKRL